MTVWTEERIAEARRLWEEGYSASLIAEMLGGVTKNSIIGKAFRGKWGQRRPAYARSTAPKTRRKYVKPAEAKIRERPPQPPPRPPPPPKPRKKPGTYTLLDLKPNECRWPMNSPERGGKYRFCGLPAEEGSYCREHAAIGFSGKGTARRTEVAGWVPRPVEFSR